MCAAVPCWVEDGNDAVNDVNDVRGNGAESAAATSAARCDRSLCSLRPPRTVVRQPHLASTTTVLDMVLERTSGGMYHHRPQNRQNDQNGQNGQNGHDRAFVVHAPYTRWSVVSSSLAEMIMNVWIFNGVALVLSLGLLRLAQAEALEAYEIERAAPSDDCMFVWNVTEAAHMTGGWSACLGRAAFVQAIADASAAAREDFLMNEPVNAATADLARALWIGWALLFSGLTHCLCASPWHVLRDKNDNWAETLRSARVREHNIHDLEDAIDRYEYEETALRHLRGMRVFFTTWVAWYVLHALRLAWGARGGFGVLFRDGWEAQIAANTTSMAADARNVTFHVVVDAIEALVRVRGFATARSVTTTVPLDALATYRDAVRMALGVLIGVHGLVMIVLEVVWTYAVAWDTDRRRDDHQRRRRGRQRGHRCGLAAVFSCRAIDDDVPASVVVHETEREGGIRSAATTTAASSSSSSHHQHQRQHRQLHVVVVTNRSSNGGSSAVHEQPSPRARNAHGEAAVIVLNLPPRIGDGGHADDCRE